MIEQPLILISSNLINTSNSQLQNLKNYTRFTPITFGKELFVVNERLVFSDEILECLNNKLIHGIIIEQNLIKALDLKSIKVPVISEKDVVDLTNWKSFLIAIFTLQRFEEVYSSSSYYQLINFHSANKYLLMAVHQKYQKDLGKIVANGHKAQAKKAIENYYDLLTLALKNPISNVRETNMLMHVFGYFKDNLSKTEKAEFINLLNLYRQNMVTLKQILSILHLWSIKYNQTYLIKQTIFNAYPNELH